MPLTNIYKHFAEQNLRAQDFYFGGPVWTLIQFHTNGACFLVAGSYVCSA